MTNTPAPLPDDFMGCHVHNNTCDGHCPYRNNPVGNIMFIIGGRVSSDGRAYVINYFAAQQKRIEELTEALRFYDRDYTVVQYRNADGEEKLIGNFAIKAHLALASGEAEVKP